MGGVLVNISNKAFKMVMLAIGLFIVVTIVGFFVANKVMDVQYEKKVQAMLNSHDPATVIGGVLLSGDTLKGLTVDSISVKDRVAKIEVSYAEPYTESETLRTLSVFAIDTTQRATQRKAVDSVEYVFKCPFLDGNTGQQKMDLGMACTLTGADVANIDLKGYSSLLYDNPLKLGDLTEVYYHPALESGALQ